MSSTQADGEESPINLPGALQHVLGLVAGEHFLEGIRSCQESLGELQGKHVPGDHQRMEPTEHEPVPSGVPAT